MKLSTFIHKTLFSAAAGLLCLTAVSCAKPGDGSIHQAGDAFMKGNYQEAINLLEEGRKRGISYSDEYVQLMEAKSYMALSNITPDKAMEFYTLAAEKFEFAMATRPEYFELNTLGHCYLKIEELKDSNLPKDYSKAEATFKRGIELCPDLAEAYASLGSLYIKTGDGKQAQELLIKAAELFPRSNNIHAKLAVAYAMNGNSAKSAEELAKAEELKCPDLDSYRLLIAQMTE